MYQINTVLKLRKSRDNLKAVFLRLKTYLRQLQVRAALKLHSTVTAGETWNITLHKHDRFTRCLLFSTALKWQKLSLLLCWLKQRLRVQLRNSGKKGENTRRTVNRNLKKVVFFVAVLNTCSQWTTPRLAAYLLALLTCANSFIKQNQNKRSNENFLNVFKQ